MKMKTFGKTTLVIFLFLLLQYSFAANPPGYSIKIKVKGIKDTTCYLAYHFGDKQYLKDTAKVDSKGNFTFDGKDPLPGGIYMAVLPGKRYFEVIISGAENNFSMETDTADYAKNMKVKGSEENTIFYEYLRYIEPRGRTIDSLHKSLPKAKDKSDSTAIKERMATLDKEITDYRANFIVEHPTSFVTKIFKAIRPPQIPKDIEAKGDSAKYDYYKKHFFDDVDFSDDRMVRTPIFHQKLDEYIRKLVLQTPDSVIKEADILIKKTNGNKEMFKYVVWYITTTYETSNIMGMDAVFVHMVEKYYMTKKAYWVDSTTLYKIMERALILKPLLLGKTAPALVLQDTLDVSHALYDVKAKYTVVYFWDPNCGHCQKETPLLYKLYEKYYDKGVEVYAVNIATDKERWKKYIRDNNLHWLNVHDQFRRVSFKTLYDIYSTPVIYLLDEKKKIIAKRLGQEQLDELLQRELKIKPDKKPISSGEEKPKP